MSETEQRLFVRTSEAKGAGDGSSSVATSVIGVAVYFVPAIMRSEDRRVDPDVAP